MAQDVNDNNDLRGSYVNHNYVRRDVTVYGVMEHELDTLSTWNLLSSLSFSGAAASFSFCVTLYLEDQVSEARTPAGDLLLSVGQPISGLIAIVLSATGLWFLYKRGSTLSRIKRESQAVAEPKTSPDGQD
jgi:hypothetical protein